MWVSLGSSCVELCLLSHDVSFLSQVRKESHYFFNKISVPSLSFPSGTSIIQMFVCLMLSQRSLKVFSFLKILFSFCCSVGHPGCWFVLLRWLLCWWFLQCIFFFSFAIAVFFTSACLFKRSSPQVFCFTLRLGKHLMTVSLNSLSGKLLISVSLVFFFSSWGFSLFLHLRSILCLHFVWLSMGIYVNWTIQLSLSQSGRSGHVWKWLLYRLCVLGGVGRLVGAEQMPLVSGVLAYWVAMNGEASYT